MNLSQLDALLARVRQPARYTGHEWNCIIKDWSATPVRMALAYPDVYDVGMSNLGLAILYDLVNRIPTALAERVYAPWTDMEAQMRAAGVPLYSLESRHPVTEFDLIGVSLQYELNYSNVLNLLDLAGIPLFAADREDGIWPVVIGGGSSSYNPEPLADFFDLFVIGEAEEALPELVALYEKTKQSYARGPALRAEFLQRAATIDGVYVPSFYNVQYADDGTVACITPMHPHAPPTIRRRMVNPLPPTPTRPVVPYVRAIHDRAMVEIMRGCTRGCRFCQAGMIYRPVRERPMSEVLDTIDELERHTGYEEVGLLSLSSADYREIGPLVRALNERYAGRRLALSLPSLRIDSFSVELSEMIQETRKTGLTFAPEAGSDRMRRVISKNVTAEDLLRTAETAYSAGWLRIKLYFMMGLPTETMDDVLAIADLVRQVRDIGWQYQGKRASVSVSVNTFIPKPHTPFQWEPLADAGAIRERQAALRRALNIRGVKLSWSDEDSTWLEAALSRADRRAGGVIRRAWELGARFDAWHEVFRPDVWRQAFADMGVDPAFYTLRHRGREERLPWAHIDTGVDNEYLWQEYQQALRAEPGADCREGCLNCGVRQAFELAACPPEGGAS